MPDDVGQSGVINVRGLDRLIRRFDRMQRHFLTTDLMSEIAQYIIFSIQARTAKGQDVYGSRFDPYSPRYEKFRSDLGHPTDKVNLFFSGTMMSSMTFSSTNDTAKVFFLNTSSPPIKYKLKRGGTSEKKSKITSSQKAFFLNKDREFFAISVKEQQAILEMVRLYLHNLMFTAT